MAEQDFLGLIRETERQAEEMVGQARLQARQIQDQARQLAAETMSEARLRMESETADRLAGAEGQAAALLDAARLQSEQQTREIRMIAPARLESAARLVAERIVNDSVHR